MKDNHIHIEALEDELTTDEVEGKTAMMIAIDGQYEGRISVADTIKETAHEAIKRIKDDGLEVVMLTRDNERTAKAIDKHVGIDHVIAEVLPEDKPNPNKQLQEENKKVA